MRIYDWPQSELHLKARCVENKAIKCECKFWGFRARRRLLAAAAMDFQADPLSSGSREEGQSITFPPREVEEGGSVGFSCPSAGTLPSSASPRRTARFPSFVTVQLRDDQIHRCLLFISLPPSEIGCVSPAIW